MEERVKALEHRVKQLEIENDQLETAYFQMERYVLQAIQRFGGKAVWVINDLMDDHEHDITKVSAQFFSDAKNNTIQ